MLLAAAAEQNHTHTVTKHYPSHNGRFAIRCHQSTVLSYYPKKAGSQGKLDITYNC